MTDEDGRFQFHLPVGRYRIGRFASEIAVAPANVVVREGETTEVELHSLPTQRVFGRIRTDEGKPAANVPVIFENLPARRMVVTDMDGFFELQLPTLKWDYSCYPNEIPGYLPRRTPDLLSFDVKSGEDIELPDLIVQTGRVIHGVIRGIDTNERRIRVVIAKIDRNQYWSAYDADGKFQLTIPRSVSVEELRDFEIRFVEKPIAITSRDPLTLEAGLKTIDR